MRLRTTSIHSTIDVKSTFTYYLLFSLLEEITRTCNNLVTFDKASVQVNI